MKKLIYGGLFLAFVGITIVACKKTKTQPNKQNEIIETKYRGISVSNNMLKFEKLEDYFSIVNNESSDVRVKFAEYAGTLGFKNYFSKTHIQLKSGNSQEMDDFFGQIINEDACIQIGQHIYNIDLIKERVFVLNSNKVTNAYDDLVEGNLSNKDISEYQLTDDVLSIVNGGIAEKCASPGGFEVWSTSGSGTSLEFRSIIKLFSAGVYYRVTGRTKKIGGYVGDYRFKLSVVVSTANIHRRPCSNTDVTSHLVGLKANTLNVTEPAWEAYSKSWNVKNMNMCLRSDAEFISPEGTAFRSTPNVCVNF